MARPLRIEYPNATYHVSNRGAERKRIFPSAAYYDAFLDGLTEACRRLNVQVYALCVLPNEYHLLINTPEGNLSRFMRQVDGLYTQSYQNLKHSRGSVFRARYKSVLIQADSYLLPLSRYLHTLSSGSRKSTADNLWSTLGEYLSTAKGPKWLDKAPVFAQLGVSARAVGQYKQYMADPVEEELLSFYGRKNVLSILGDDKFRKLAQGKLKASTARGVSRGAAARKRPSIKAVVSAVATLYKVETKSIYKAARGPGSRNLPRWVSMYLCQEVAGVTLQTIASRFGLKRYGTVSTTIGKLKLELAEKPKTLAQVKKLTAALQG